MEAVGRVAALWRYPVKSMRGEPLEHAAFGQEGIPGDRGVALADAETGRLLSAKRVEQLLAARAVARPGGPVVVLPDGRALYAEDAADALSEWLGRRVTVVRAPGGTARAEVESEEGATFRAPAGTFFDAAPVHILTTATLAHLGSLLPSGRFDPRRFRPNVVIETELGLRGDVEQGWVGASLAIGDARFEVTRACTRCVMTTAAQDDLEKDRDILRTIARLEENETGVYARVRAPGAVSVGDAVGLTPP